MLNQLRCLSVHDNNTVSILSGNLLLKPLKIEVHGVIFYQFKSCYLISNSYMNKHEFFYFTNLLFLGKSLPQNIFVVNEIDLIR